MEPTRAGWAQRRRSVRALELERSIVVVGRRGRPRCPVVAFTRAVQSLCSVFVLILVVIFAVFVELVLVIPLIVVLVVPVVIIVVFVFIFVVVPVAA